MLKKLIFVAVILAFLGGFFVYSKNEARKLRQQQNLEAQNKKAEEISLTFLEGWSNREIAEYLEKQGVVKSSEFLDSVKNFNTTEYGSFLPKEAQGSLQGFLYPDTYRFFKSITDRAETPAKEASDTVIKKMLDNFQVKFPAGAEVLTKKQGLTLYEAITLASIVEKEAGKFPNDKATIAGIFYNRLNIGMALQSDATINYATGKSEASPSLDDLNVDSAYNTYKHKGLPPSPISNPSIDSINAVLSPIKSDYLYYLHDQKTGEPVYAQTYEEHLANKQKYLK